MKKLHRTKLVRSDLSGRQYLHDRVRHALFQDGPSLGNQRHHLRDNLLRDRVLGHIVGVRPVLVLILVLVLTRVCIGTLALSDCQA